MKKVAIIMGSDSDLPVVEKGIDISLISDVTGLSIEEINKL